MSPRQKGVLLYWFAVLALTVAFDVGAWWIDGREATISAVMADWACRCPWLPLVWGVLALVIFWHVAYGFWPIFGD